MMEARLSIEMEPTGHPRPTGAGVFVGADLVARISLHELDRASTEVQSMLKTRYGENWIQQVEREAAERVSAELSKPDAAYHDDLGQDDVFNPWRLFPALFGSYASDFDDCAIDVLSEILEGEKKREDLGAEMFREMLCRADLCDYGSSPRVCFPTPAFKMQLPALIHRWKAYRKMQWGSDHE